MKKIIAEMELEKYRRAIRCALGYRELKKEQETVNNMFDVLPTGFGKSLCYICSSGIFDVLLKNHCSTPL